MTKVQIVENEDLLQYADFGNCEVWLLNRTNNASLTDDAEHFAVHAYTCDYEKIKVTNTL